MQLQYQLHLWELLVGAIKAYPGIYALAEPPADLKNAVDNLNNTLTLSTNTIKTSIDNIRELSQNNQKIEKIVNISENKKFNDYRKQLDVILSIKVKRKSIMF